MQWKPNVTVAAIARQDDRFLFVEERIPDSGIVFNQPAGHLERDESLLDAVKREVLEETAWQFCPESLTGIYMSPGPGNITYLRFCFYGTCDEFDSNRELDEGIIRTHWLSQPEIESRKELLRSPMVLRCLSDHLAGKRYPLEIINHYLSGHE